MDKGDPGYLLFLHVTMNLYSVHFMTFRGASLEEVLLTLLQAVYET